MENEDIQRPTKSRKIDEHKRLHSVFSIFGQDHENHRPFDQSETGDMMVHQSNFHARLMKLLNPDLKWHKGLDEHFSRVLGEVDMFDDP